MFTFILFFLEASVTLLFLRVALFILVNTGVFVTPSLCLDLFFFFGDYTILFVVWSRFQVGGVRG